MSLIFDGILLTVCILSIILGAKRGFIRSVMGVCTLIAALFVAYAFYEPVADIVERQPFIQGISSSITDTIKSLSRNETGTYDLDRLFSEMPDSFQQILERYEADADELTQHVPAEPGVEETEVDRLSDLIAEPVAKAISGVLSFLALFVGAVIALKIFTWLLDLIFQLPILKTANTMLGFLFGVAAALVWMWVLSSLSVTLIHAMSSITPELFPDSLIDNTVLLKFFSTTGIGDIMDVIIR